MQMRLILLLLATFQTSSSKSFDAGSESPYDQEQQYAATIPETGPAQAFLHEHHLLHHHSTGNGELEDVNRHLHKQEDNDDDDDDDGSGVPFHVRAHWMRQANAVLGQLTSSPCPFGAFGTVVVNHTSALAQARERSRTRTRRQGEDGSQSGSKTNTDEASGSDPDRAVDIHDFGDLVCIGANRVGETGNPTLHGEIAAIANCTSVLTDPNGKYKLQPDQVSSAFAQLSLYTNGEPCPMCASAIRWSRFRECIYGTTLPTLIDLGWSQIPIRAEEIWRRSRRFLDPSSSSSSSLSSLCPSPSSTSRKLECESECESESGGKSKSETGGKSQNQNQRTGESRDENEKPPSSRLIGPILANETDVYFAWQFDHGPGPSSPCPKGCRRRDSTSTSTCEKEVV